MLNSENENLKSFIILEKTESLLPAASDPLGIFIKEGNYPNHLKTSLQPFYDNMYMCFQTMPQTFQTQAIPRILEWLPLNGVSTFSSL